jgi:uncharacterized protein (TIGR02246 family)
MKHLSIRSEALLTLLCTPGCLTSHVSADSALPAANVDDFSALARAHDAAWNAHDPQMQASLFAEHGTLVTPIGTRVEGRDALLKSFSLPGPTKQTSSSMRIDAVQWLAHDLVVIDASQTLTGPGVEILGASEARLTAVVRRVGGEWLFEVARPFVAVNM